jgi:Domain of unknown function (DUF4118)
MPENRAWLTSPLAGVVAGIAAVAVISAAIGVIDDYVPVLSLGVLYLFAVLPIAVVWGPLHAVFVGIASMLAFNFFFLPPVHTLTLAERSNWLALAVYLTTAIVVGSLASRVRRRRDEAVQREREAALLADIAADNGVSSGAEAEKSLQTSGNWTRAFPQLYPTPRSGPVVQWTKRGSPKAGVAGSIPAEGIPCGFKRGLRPAILNGRGCFPPGNRTSTKSDCCACQSALAP